MAQALTNTVRNSTRVGRLLSCEANFPVCQMALDLQYSVLKCGTQGACISVKDMLRLPIALQTDHATGTQCANMPRSPTEFLSIPTGRRPLQEHVRRDSGFSRLNAASELFRYPPIKFVGSCTPTDIWLWAGDAASCKRLKESKRKAPLREYIH
jgi:hypothetical protein